MNPPMYAFSIPALKRGLANLDAILSKASAWATTRKIDPDALLRARLAPDMLTLVKQVQIACDMAKNGTARLAAAEAPKFEDTEASFDDLHARIAKTVAFLDTLQPAQFEAAAQRDISIPAGGNTLQFKGEDYLQAWILPNFYFHVTTAYALLRHNGLEIGKRDFLGPR